MRSILIWTEAELPGLGSAWGIFRVLTEVDEEGSITRELGYDAAGKVVHRHPGEPSRSKHGIFDLVNIAPSNASEMELHQFDQLWSA